MKKELIKKEEEQKEEIEKEKKSLEKLKNINKKRESYSIYAKNNPINQKDQVSNNGNKNIKEMSEDSSNGPQKKTLKDSELEQEFLIINESNNNEIIQIDNKNNYINDIDEKDINNYQKLNDKEVSNKIKLEKKKVQDEEMKKKQEKIMNTLQNLIRLGEQCKTNNSPHKRADSKNHLKPRKVVNEYYVGTEESKNNTSTFVDKQEYYKSILAYFTKLWNHKISN